MSDDKRLEVEFGARTSELAAKTQEAVGQVRTFGSAVAEAAISGGNAWQGLGNVFAEQGGAIGKSIGLVTTALTGLGAIVAGSIFAKMVMGAIDSAAGLHDMSQKTGMAVESLSALAAVGKTSDTSLEMIAAAANKMSVNLASASEEGKGAGAALRALGIDFDSFQAMNPDQRMQTVAVALSKFEDGAGKTAAAIALMGRQGAEMLPFMADLAEAGELHAKVTTEQAAAADEFGDNLAKLRGAGEAWKRTLSLAMAPALADVSRAVLDLWGKSGGLKEQIQNLANDGSIDRWTRGAISGVTYVIDAFVVLKRAVVSVIEFFTAGFAQAVTFVDGIAEAMSKLGQGDFSGAVSSVRSAFRQMSAIGDAYFDDQGRKWMEMLPGEQMRNAMQAAGAASPTGDKKQALNFKNAKEGGKDAKEESRMPIYEKQLEEARYAAAQLDAIHGMTKAQELAFWQDVLAKAQLTEKDRVQVEKRVAAAKIDILKEEAKERGELDKVSLESVRDRLLNEVALQEEAARTNLASGAITQEQMLALQQQFEDRKHAIRMVALQQAEQALDPQLDVVKVSQIHAQIEQAEMQHQLRMAQIRTQVAQQSAKDQGRVWDELSATVSGLWDKGIQAMMNGTLTWRGAFKAIGTEMTRWFANSVIGEQVKAWLRGQMVKLSSAITGAAAERTAVAAGSAATVATKATEATAVVGANAAEAASGAAASQASIPWVGPVLAAAAFAATMAMVLGARSSIKSAEGGYDIPAGVNPLTQLHQNEMVLPAEHANTIRRLGRTGVGGDGASDFGGEPAPVYNITVQHNISALDGADVKRVLMRNSEAVAASIHKAVRDFSITPETLRRGRS